MTNVAYEPMDIDSSANSCTAMEISYNEITFENDKRSTEMEIETSFEKRKDKASDPARAREVKKFHIDRSLNPKTNSFIFNRIYAVVFFAGVVISILSFTVVNFKCYHELNLILLKKTLFSKVYGQTEAIETFIQALGINATSKILFLYGGTGVGKTLSISIILDKLVNYTNIYHYTMPSFTDKFSMDLKLGFNFCQKSTIIIDDLNADDKHNIAPMITEIIEKTENLKKNVTVILIYNCNNIKNSFSRNCDNSFVTKLQKMFIDVKASKKFIRYKPLTKEILQKCIEIELDQRFIRNVDINRMMGNFDVMHDGCKGVHTKIKALLIKETRYL